MLSLIAAVGVVVIVANLRFAAINPVPPDEKRHKLDDQAVISVGI